MTQGKPLPTIIKFSLPVLVGALLQQFHLVVDMFVVGNAVGARALSAIGATSSTNFLAMSVVTGLTAGITAVIAREFGAKDYSMFAKSVSSAIYIGLAGAAVLAVAGVFGSGAVMRLLNTPPDIYADSVLYLRVTIGASAGMVLFNTAAALLRAVGDSLTPLVFLVATSLLNIMLDFLFVWALGMGVGGAALAMVIAQISCAALMLAYMRSRLELFRLRREDFEPHAKTIGAILFITLPAMVQALLLAFGDMMITRTVNGFGSEVVAAYTIGNRVFMFAMTLGMNLAIAHAVFAGQNLGARQVERIKDSFRKTAFLTIALSVSAAALVYLFGGDLARLFMSDSDQSIEIVVSLARHHLRVNSMFFVFLGMIWLYNHTLRGMGEVVVPFISSLAELVSKVGLSIVLSRAFGHVGMWYVMPLGWVLGVLPCAAWYHAGKWARKAS